MQEALLFLRCFLQRLDSSFKLTKSSAIKISLWGWEGLGEQWGSCTGCLNIVVKPFFASPTFLIQRLLSSALKKNQYKTNNYYICISLFYTVEQKQFKTSRLFCSTRATSAACCICIVTSYTTQLCCLFCFFFFF